MIQVYYPASAQNLYAVLFDATGKAWNGYAFVTPVQSNWSSYANPLTELSGTNIYQLPLPPTIPATLLHYYIYHQTTATPTPSNTPIAFGELHWSPSGPLHLANVIAAASASYPATTPWTYTLKSPLNTPIAGCRIDIYSDSECRNLVARGLTDTFGNAHFYLDPGTYYIRRYKPGWTFTDPDVETIP